MLEKVINSYLIKVYSHFIPDTQEKVVNALNNLLKKTDANQSFLF